MTTPPSAIAKPAAVSRAIGLLCISLGTLFVISLWLSFHDFRAAQTGFFELAIMSWLTHKTNQGRNWARVTFLVLYLLGVLLAIPAFFMGPPPTIFDVGVFIIQAALQAVALFMLFSSDARPWFRAALSQPKASDESDHNA